MRYYHPLEISIEIYQWIFASFVSLILKLPMKGVIESMVEGLIFNVQNLLKYVKYYNTVYCDDGVPLERDLKREHSSSLGTVNKRIKRDSED